MQRFDASTPIGFIGLGVMGGGMANRLIAAGQSITVYNRTHDKVAPFVAAGALAGATPSEVAERSRVLFLSLPETAHVEAALFGADGAADSLAPGACVIDTSTIDAGASRRFAARLAERGVDMLDAPVSGGAQGAAEGKLTMMVGGPVEVVEAVRDVCAPLATSFLRIGDHGAGQIAKCCNQIAVTNAMIGVAEAMALARKQGVDPALVRDALLGGAARSFSLDKHGERLLQRNFRAGFTARLMRKDLDLAAAAGHAAGAFLPGTHGALQLLEALVASGEGDRDWSALGLLIERLSGLDLPTS